MAEGGSELMSGMLTQLSQGGLSVDVAHHLYSQTLPGEAKAAKVAKVTKVAEVTMAAETGQVLGARVVINLRKESKL